MAATIVYDQGLWSRQGAKPNGVAGIPDFCQMGRASISARPRFAEKCDTIPRSRGEHADQAKLSF